MLKASSVLRFNSFNSLKILPLVVSKFCSAFTNSSDTSFRFSIAIDNEHGQGTAQELEYLARTTVKFMRCDYEELIKKYKELATMLINKIDKS